MDDPAHNSSALHNIDASNALGNHGRHNLDQRSVRFRGNERAAHYGIQFRVLRVQSFRVTASDEITFSYKTNRQPSSSSRLGCWDALGFGIGVALLIYLGISYSKWPKELRSAFLVLFFIALWFTLFNWVHDGLHNTGAMPPNWALLAVTEFLFHVPWPIFSLALVLVVRQLFRTYKK